MKLYYLTALRRVQITPKASTNIMRYLYSRGPVGQIFSQRASDEFDCSYEKMADNLNYFSDDEESEWVANIDPSLLDKSNKEKQLDDREISSFMKIETATQQRRRKLTLMF